MEKTVFSVDEIHALRVELTAQRAKMTPEEARRDFSNRVDRGRRAIEELRESLPGCEEIRCPDVMRTSARITRGYPLTCGATITRLL